MLPPQSPFAADIYCTGGLVDWGSEQLLLACLQQQNVKGTCYDVGGNMGYYSVLLSSAAAQVFAFEPDARNHDDLVAQQIFGLTLVRKAVSDRCGTARFDVSRASTVGHLSNGEAGRDSVEVETITLDEFRRSRPADERVTAVKVDIEGYEISCLRGAEQLAVSDRPLFLIEFAIEEGRPNSFPALGEFVRRHRYDIYAMIRRTRGRTAFRTMLEKTNASSLPSLNHKMLFLVPEGNSFFEKQCAAGFCFETMKPALL